MFTDVGRQSALAATIYRKNASVLLARTFINIVLETSFPRNVAKLAPCTSCHKRLSSFRGRMTFLVRKRPIPLAIFVLYSDISILIVQTVLRRRHCWYPLQWGTRDICRKDEDAIARLIRCACPVRYDLTTLLCLIFSDDRDHL
jgi:hypothetical protein